MARHIKTPEQKIQFAEMIADFFDLSNNDWCDKYPLAARRYREITEKNMEENHGTWEIDFKDFVAYASRCDWNEPCSWPDGCGLGDEEEQENEFLEILENEVDQGRLKYLGEM